jgi:uncharacterized protein (DUF488 family)
MHHLEGQKPVAINKETKVIYTVGHSALPSDDFIVLLERYAIGTVADVRRFPTSRKNPQYSQEALHAALTAAEMDYVWLGDDLGGYRSGGYEPYMQTDGFHEGLTRLEEIAGRSTTAIMCAEKLFSRCHRRFIADMLVEREWHVVHIVDATTTHDHTFQPSLF